VTVAVKLIVPAMAHQSNSATLCEFLEQPQRKFLTVVFDRLVQLIDRTVFAQFGSITPF
jgi:hypothetical protein